MAPAADAAWGKHMPIARSLAHARKRVALKAAGYRRLLDALLLPLGVCASMLFHCFNGRHREAHLLAHKRHMHFHVLQSNERVEPWRRYAQLRPRFSTVPAARGGYQSYVLLPNNCPVGTVAGLLQPRKALAAASACLEAVKALHKARPWRPQPWSTTTSHALP